MALFLYRLKVGVNSHGVYKGERPVEEGENNIIAIRKKEKKKRCATLEVSRLEMTNFVPRFQGFKVLYLARVRFPLMSDEGVTEIELWT